MASMCPRIRPSSAVIVRTGGQRDTSRDEEPARSPDGDKYQPRCDDICIARDEECREREQTTENDDNQYVSPPTEPATVAVFGLADLHRRTSR